MRNIWNYLVDKKIWVYRAAALVSMLAYFSTKDVVFIILFWIQIIGIEVIIQSQAGSEVNILLKTENPEYEKIIEELKEDVQEATRTKERAMAHFEVFKKENDVLNLTVTGLNKKLVECEGKVEEFGNQYVKENETAWDLMFELEDTNKWIEEQKKIYTTIRDKQKEVIEKLRVELEETRSDRTDLQTDLDAMTLKAKGMIEKPDWKGFPIDNADRTIASVIKEMFEEDDTEPIKPKGSLEKFIDSMDAFRDAALASSIMIEQVDSLPMPESVPEEPIKAQENDVVVPENEVMVPDYNDTAVETTEEATQEKIPVKRNTKKWNAEHFTGYIEMIKAGTARDTVIALMMDEMHVTKPTAMGLYYKWIKQSAPIPELIKKVPPPPASKLDPVERESEKSEPVEVVPTPIPVVKPAPPKPTPRISSLPAHILKHLDAMPVYPSVIQFKDAVCMIHDMAQYSVAQLKVAYKETHKNLTW